MQIPAPRTPRPRRACGAASCSVPSCLVAAVVHRPSCLKLPPESASTSCHSWTWRRWWAAASSPRLALQCSCLLTGSLHPYSTPILPQLDLEGVVRCHNRPPLALQCCCLLTGSLHPYSTPTCAAGPGGGGGLLQALPPAPAAAGLQRHADHSGGGAAPAQEAL